MLKQVQTAVTFRSKSTIGTKLKVQCGMCHKSFDQSYEICPYCDWKYGDPITADDIAIANGYLETYILGSAKGDKYCDERGGSYGHELIRFTVNLNTPELAKLFEVLLDLRDNDGCKYTLMKE
ncbi:MAG: hypothetical protein QF535_06360 [Anaerolineales bacterium]|nr:hypothetical protein [Anaerolineales bacterium]